MSVVTTLPDAMPALNACCNDCQHLNGGRLQMTPLEPRSCEWFEAI